MSPAPHRLPLLQRQIPLPFPIRPVPVPILGFRNHRRRRVTSPNAVYRVFSSLKSGPLVVSRGAALHTKPQSSEKIAVGPGEVRNCDVRLSEHVEIR